MRKRLSGLAIVAMAVAFIVGVSTEAHASFIAYICDDAACSGGGDYAVVDNGAGDALPATDGAIVMTGLNVGGVDIVVNTSLTYPALGSTSSPELDITYTATGAGTVWLYASTTGFTGDGGTATLDIGGTGTGTLTSYLYGGNSDTILDLSHLIISLSGEGTTSAAFLPSVDPYSLTLGLKIVSTDGATTGDLNATVVPEPASIFLLGLGLLGSGGAMRRRFSLK